MFKIPCSDLLLFQTLHGEARFDCLTAPSPNPRDPKISILVLFSFMSDNVRHILPTRGSVQANNNTITVLFKKLPNIEHINYL